MMLSSGLNILPDPIGYPSSTYDTSHTLVDTSLSLHRVSDSGYTSKLASGIPSARSSRPVSRSTSPVTKTTTASDYSSVSASRCTSRRTSRSNSRQVSPKRRVAVTPKSENAVIAPSTTNSGLPLTLDSGVRVFLTEPSLAAELLLQPLNLKELKSARDWLKDLDWTSLTKYQQVQDEILSVEEDFYKSYSQQPPPSSRLDDHDYDDLIRADTLVSMVELAWGSEPNFKPIINKPDSLLSPIASLSTSSDDDETATKQIPLPMPTTSRNKLSAATSALIFQSKMINQQLVSPFSSTLSPRLASEYRSSLGLINNLTAAVANSKPKREDAVFNIRYKTQSCVHFDKWNNCPAGENCHFAHGPEELRKPKQHPKFKTQSCIHFATTGICPFGNRCFFEHMPGKIGNDVN